MDDLSRLPIVILGVILGVQTVVGVVLIDDLVAYAVQLVEVRVVLREGADDVVRYVLLARTVPDTLGPHRLLHEIGLGFHSNDLFI